MRVCPVVALLSLTLGCAPKKNVPLEQIPTLPKLADVMAAQATIADPLFKKIGAPRYGEVEWAAFSDAAARLAATASKTKEFSKGAEFDALAVRIGDKAAALGAAAQGRDAAAASTALADMKATCRECHRKFR
jgi:hypothetical protein